jgi:NADH-quinone oxidoreductase subunit J
VANLLFYVMAAIAVAAAVGVVVCRNPVNSVIALLASFFALATIYLLSGFQFIAAAQILVYAGAILVLFLFVIMLLNLAHEEPRLAIDLGLLERRNSFVAACIAAALLVALLVAAEQSGSAARVEPPPAGGYDAVGALAAALFGRYILPFEAVSLLLLATTVAVLVLARRERGPRRDRGNRGEHVESATAPVVPDVRPESAERERELTSVGGGS